MKDLLTPIPGENPAGKNLRYAGTYDRIIEARRADDALEQGEWQRTIKVADWHAVVSIAAEALATQTKDLQIATWLTEAWVKLNGFSGLGEGLQLIRGFLSQFWESLYPEIEDDDLEFRAGPLEWLDRQLPLVIREVLITQRADGGENYSWQRWEESRAVDNLGRQSPEAMQEAIGDGKITGDQFDRAVAATPRAYYENLFQELNQSWKEYEQIDRRVDEKFGREAPSLLGIKKAVGDCRTLVEGIVKKKRELEPDPQPLEEEGVVEEARGEKTSVMGKFFRNIVGKGEKEVPLSSKPIRSGGSAEPEDREDAFRRLEAIAAYLKRLEPHSPVSYLIERAVRWGRMPLEEWLVEVIRSDDVLKHLRDTLGIRDSEAS